MRRAILVLITALAVSAVPAAASAGSAVTFHGTIAGATCVGGTIGTITGTWNVNVTPGGPAISWTMFQDGKIHAVIAGGVIPWVKDPVSPPYVFTWTSAGTTATVTVTPATAPSVSWELHIVGVPSCPDFTATGTGIAA